ncbi:MAG: hypothetical protein C4547_08980 [Phycisphaerales bacterium]|nr:MAG: hypothetical protein C4547_08980 [Phycisphaerales bacterium]
MVLVVVLVCMTLAGSLIVLIGASLAQHATTVRQERIEMTLRQLIDSGRAWAEVQAAGAAGAERGLSPPGAVLDAGALAPPDAEATVEVSIETDARGVRTLIVTATLTREGDAPVRRTGRFIVR